MEKPKITFPPAPPFDWSAASFVIVSDGKKVVPVVDMKTMPDPKILDADEHKPTEPGFYPGVISWESYEGGFPHGLYWDGKEWEDLPVVYYVAERFETAQLAEDRAYDLCLGW